jgi:single-strand DNA-binding protein
VANLGRDLELKQTKGGTAVAELSLAVTTRVKRNDEWINETSWVRASLFGRRAEAMARMLKKGDKVGVTGQLLIREFTRADGTKGTSVEVHNAEVSLCGNPQGGRREQPTSRDFGGSDDFPDDDGFGSDDIPF